MEDAFDGGQVRKEPHDDGEEWHIGLLNQAQSPLGSSLDHRQGAGSAQRRDPRRSAASGGAQAGGDAFIAVGAPVVLVPCPSGELATGIGAETCRLATYKALELPSSGHRERSRSGTG